MNEEINKQRSRLIKIFKNSGYKTQTAIVRDLIKKGPYEGKKLNNLGPYLSQVLNGHRAASKKLADGLAKICRSDIIIEILNPPTCPEAKIEYGLETKLEESYNSLASIFQKLSWEDKMKLCLDFCKYVESYATEFQNKISNSSAGSS